MKPAFRFFDGKTMKEESEGIPFEAKLGYVLLCLVPFGAIYDCFAYGYVISKIWGRYLVPGLGVPAIDLVTGIGFVFVMLCFVMKVGLKRDPVPFYKKLNTPVQKALYFSGKLALALATPWALLGWAWFMLKMLG